MPTHPRRRVALGPKLDGLEARALLDAGALNSLRALAAAQVGSTSSSGTTASTSLLDLLNSSQATRTSSLPSASNTDTLPSGVANVPRGFLVAYDGNASGTSGTGSTIVRINRDGSQTPFFQSGTPLGLTGLGVLSKGFVFAATNPGGGSAGSLLVLNREGQEIANIQNASWLDQPTSITVHDMGDRAQVFVANAGNGSVVRLDVTIKDGTPRITGGAVVASGYTVGSTSGPSVAGLAYNASTGLLYVSSTAGNAVYAIPNAGSRNSANGTGRVVIQNDSTLSSPTGLVVAPSGDLIVAGLSAGGTTGMLAEYTPSGQFVSTLDLGTTTAIAGVALKANGQGAAIAIADDTTSTLDMIQIGPRSNATTNQG